MDEISGHAIVKMIDNEGHCTVVLKLKFHKKLCISRHCE